MGVCVGDAQTSDGRSMSLNLCRLLKGKLPDLDRAWVLGFGLASLVNLANTGE